MHTPTHLYIPTYNNQPLNIHDHVLSPATIGHSEIREDSLQKDYSCSPPGSSHSRRSPAVVVELFPVEVCSLLRYWDCHKQLNVSIELMKAFYLK